MPVITLLAVMESLQSNFTFTRMHTHTNTHAQAHTDTYVHTALGRGVCNAVHCPMMLGIQSSVYYRLLTTGEKVTLSTADNLKFSGNTEVHT